MHLLSSLRYRFVSIALLSIVVFIGGLCLEIERRWITLCHFARGFRYLLGCNLRHYSLALFGIRLRLDPDYPLTFDFLKDYISDPVLEYRTYFLVVFWGLLLAYLLPYAFQLGLLSFFVGQSWTRSYYYSSSLAFWRQAYRECPRKTRTQHLYVNRLKFELDRTTDLDTLGALNMELTNVLETICPGITSHMTIYTKPREGEKPFSEVHAGSR